LIESCLKAGEGEGEWGYAVGAYVRTVRVRVGRTHGPCGLKDEGTLQVDGDGIVRKDGQASKPCGRIGVRRRGLGFLAKNEGRNKPRINGKGIENSARRRLNLLD
jgi:hypothetical protein